MAININANMLLGSAQFLDARQSVETLADLKALNENIIPNGFECYVTSLDTKYKFLSSNTVDATTGKWREITNGTTTDTCAEWSTGIDYNVGDIIKKDNVKRMCVTAHTSADFDTEQDNWIYVLEEYYYVTQAQYDTMVANGLITDDNKHLCIVDGHIGEDGTSIELWEQNKTYKANSLVIYDGYIWQANEDISSDEFLTDYWNKIGDDITELTKDDIEALLGLSEEELEGLTTIINDEQILTNKTYSSSKIHYDILKCLVDSKQYTLDQIGLASTASYKVVESLDDMIEDKYIYLVEHGDSFDMYILDADTGLPVTIGNTSVNVDLKIDETTKNWVLNGRDLGICAEGQKGEQGFSPIIEENVDNSDTVYKLDITTETDTFTTANLKGTDGRSIRKIELDADNNLITKFSDGSTENIGELNVNIAGSFITSEGFGDLRYLNGVFQYYNRDTDTWLDVNMTSNNIYIINMIPQAMYNIMGVYDSDSGYCKLKWTEAKDTVVDGQIVTVVEKIIIRRKLGSAPIDCNDGELVLEHKRKDFGKYKNNWYVDDSFVPNVDDVWYYKAFPISTTGFINETEANTTMIKCKIFKLYGFILNQNESEPSEMITYIEDNQTFAPAYMDYATGIFDYGSWSDAFFIKNLKPCMLNYDGTVAYELDKDDYTKKVDGSASDIANASFGGNAMIGIPKVYWKIVDNGDNTCNVYFSDTKVDDDFVCWSHIDNNGNEIDYCYMPIYNGYNDGSRLRSLSGKTVSGLTTVTKEISLATANNQDSNVIWYTEVFSDRTLINLLLLLIGKSTDTQTVFGNGHYDDAPNYPVTQTGTMDTKGLFYGSTEKTIGVKVFGMEHWWGNQWRRIAGFISNKGMRMIKLTYGQSDGSTTDGYNTTSNGYINIGCTPTGSSGGYINKMIFSPYGLTPVACAGSSTTYYADQLHFSLSMVGYLLVGGCSGDGFGCGAFAYAESAQASTTNALYGANISCKPLA